MSDALDDARRLLAQLKQRLVAGELDRAEYQAQRELVLADLSPDDLEALGITTASPRPTTPAPGTPRPITGSSLGPSGGSGRGLRTSVPTLADLDLGPGTVLLGQWRLERELGRGGFGAVFEAEELHLHEKQAVKVLDPGMVAKEDLIARFRREVSLMRKLVHPRIVRVYDYREDLPQLIALISMELVTGGSVKQLLATAKSRNVEIPIRLTLEILRQTLEALAEAHSAGVIHRDVTPGNVLLAGGSPADLLSDPTLDPKVKLVDFGIAGLVERSELSQKSRVLGTAAYVAPEVLDPFEEVSPAADVYGAGVMGYELLTMRLPGGRFKPPSEHRRQVPSSLSNVIMEHLEQEPTARLTANMALERFAKLAGTVEIHMPELGESTREATIVKWLAREGDAVERDQPLFEVSTDKVDAEIPSPVAGSILSILQPEGATVAIGGTVATFSMVAHSAESSNDLDSEEYGEGPEGWDEDDDETEDEELSPVQERSRSRVLNLTREIPPSKYFRNSGGLVCKHVAELAWCLTDAKMLDSYSMQNRDAIAAWVEAEFGDSLLAEKLRLTGSYREMGEVTFKYLAGL